MKNPGLERVPGFFVCACRPFCGASFSVVTGPLLNCAGESTFREAGSNEKSRARKRAGVLRFQLSGGRACALGINQVAAICCGRNGHGLAALAPLNRTLAP